MIDSSAIHPSVACPGAGMMRADACPNAGNAPFCVKCATRNLAVAGGENDLAMALEGAGIPCELYYEGGGIVNIHVVGPTGWVSINWDGISVFAGSRDADDDGDPRYFGVPSPLDEEDKDGPLSPEDVQGVIEAVRWHLPFVGLPKQFSPYGKFGADYCGLS